MARKHTAPAANRPAAVCGLHKKAQKAAKNNHHGKLTMLSRSSEVATGSSAIDATSTPRTAAEPMWPLDMWKTRHAVVAKPMAPARAKISAARPGGAPRATSAKSRGKSWA